MSFSSHVQWKGVGVPVGRAPGHIRPLTNNDPGNVFATGFGLPRPIKHYRKGRAVGTPAFATATATATATTPPLVEYNLHRFVRSSTPGPLGGSSSSSGLLNDTMGLAGGYSVGTPAIAGADANAPQSTTLSVSYYPNPGYLLENPRLLSSATATAPATAPAYPVRCCSQATFAARRVLYASTNLSKHYCATTQQYLRQKHATFAQNSFHQSDDATATTTPGGCPTSVYKPNNRQFATQGAVSSSTRLLKLAVNTLSTYAARSKYHNNNMGDQLVTATQLVAGDDPHTAPFLKNKVPLPRRSPCM